MSHGNATPSEATMARVNAALDKMRAIAHAEGMEMVRNADNTGWVFVASESPQEVTYQEAILEGANPDEPFYE